MAPDRAGLRLARCCAVDGDRSRGGRASGVQFRGYGGAGTPFRLARTAWGSAVIASLLVASMLTFGRGADVPAISESDVFLGKESFSKNETSNMNIIYAWLDGIMWTLAWDDPRQRELVYGQLIQLAELSETHLPSMAFGVGQALYSYFWFEDNGGNVNIDAASWSVRLHEVSLDYSGCADLELGVGTFLKNVCHERWLFLIMLCAEVGAEVTASRKDIAKATVLLQRAQELFLRLLPYPFFSFRKWNSLYDINTNSHVFPEGFNQRPLWPTAAIPLASWLEENYQTFRDDLDYIVDNGLFDTLYFQGQVSMTQFSGKRESWAPLNLIHNRVLAPHACQVANRSCELLLSRPEISRCNAKDVGAAFARLQPGMGIKPHMWTAPPRLGVHLGLRTPPGAHMLVGNHAVTWEQGRALVFDDTYIHSVKHTGSEERYLLIAWFCHPCDHVHAEVPPEDPQRLCPQL